MDLYTSSHDLLTDDDLQKIKEKVVLRCKHYPLQYLTGSTDFFGLSFIVTQDVLIPRPETEILVEKVIEYAKTLTHLNRKITILDIGTGSGNIAITLAKEVIESHVFACDVSLNALRVAQQNSAMNKVEDRLNLFASDLFSSVSNHLTKFDIIVSNPPYVADNDWDRLPYEVRNYEPRGALYGGEKGLAVYEQIIDNAKHYLMPQGILFLEIGETQAESIKKMVEKISEINVKEIIKDYNQKDRIVVIERITCNNG